jgi:glucan phosphoethanolaminetransferase (alkaline phosphatase superfamily)
MENVKQEERNKSEILINVFVIIIIVLVFGITVFLLFLLVTNKVSEKWLEIVVGFASVFASLCVAFIIIVIQDVFVQKKKGKTGKIKKTRKEISSMVLEIPKHQFDQLPKDSKEMLIIKKVNSNGEYNNKICYFCKKNIGDIRIILQCPNCFTYFHEEELLDWSCLLED